MPRFTENQRRHTIGILQAGLTQNIVAKHFGVHRNTMQSLLRRFRQSGNTIYCQRSGRPRVTSHQQDNHIRLVHLRIDSRRQISLQEASPDYDQSALKQYAIYFVIVTSGHKVQQSVHCCCLGNVQLDWRDVDVKWDSENRIGPISCSQMNLVSTYKTWEMADPENTAA
jgi:hypothetical protein